MIFAYDAVGSRTDRTGKKLKGCCLRHKHWRINAGMKFRHESNAQVPVRLSFTSYLMGEPKEIVIFKKAYELSLEVFRCTKLFPKSQRFLMANRLEELIIAILEKIIQANEAWNKLRILNELNALLERSRILIRLSKDLTYLDFKKYEALSLGANEIGRMLGGWIKYCLKEANVNT